VIGCGVHFFDIAVGIEVDPTTNDQRASGVVAFALLRSSLRFRLFGTACFIGVPSGRASSFVRNPVLSSPSYLHSRAGAVPRGGFFLRFFFSSGVWELDSVPLFSY
jgi:hypothetical protein